MTRMDKDQFQRVAKALADPRRVEILEMIASRGDVGCSKLCGSVPIAQATVSHHIKELVNAGLVQTRREGQFVYCEARNDVLRAYIAELEGRLVREQSTQ